MEPSYLPPFGELQRALSTSSDGATVTMSSDVFKLLLGGLAQASGFNAEWYRDFFPDVAPAIRDGLSADELTHFIEVGYSEGRFPAPVALDEQWYRKNYPDVDEAIKRGEVESPGEHYVECGWKEGRAPDAKTEVEARRWRQAIESSAAAIPIAIPAWDKFSTAKAGPRSRLNKSRLERYFDARKKGNGIWKWRHYFDIYERHFGGFVGTDVRILEIGVFSGGSLEMWQDYFGPKAKIYGVDIQKACKAYNRDGVEIFIGDQGDRGFWRQFKKKVPALDLVVDDGSHEELDQILTLEELLPHLRPGGVYLCEDLHYEPHLFASYVHSLAHKLNNFEGRLEDEDDPEWGGGCVATPFQEAVGSIHLYPFAAAIERNLRPMKQFLCPRHGSKWQPY